MENTNYIANDRRKDVLYSFLLSALVLIGLVVAQSWQGMLTLIDEEGYTYSLEYVQSLDGFRDSLAIANVTLFLFWGIMGLGLYYSVIIIGRSMYNVRQFYIIERYYVNKKSFADDIKQILVEFILVGSIFIISLLVLFIVLPVLFEYFLISLLASSIPLATIISFIIYILLGVVFLFVQVLYRLYVLVRIRGLS